MTDPFGPSASRFEFSGTLLKAGGVVSTSTTVTLNVAWLEFPCASFAVQVTVVAGGSGVLRLKRDGAVITGGVVSTRVTVTVKLFCALLPCESVALHVTLVGPSGNVAPEAGVQVGVIGPSRLSFALAE